MDDNRIIPETTKETNGLVMIQIYMLKAGKGDFFWLRYGDTNQCLHNILIDGGNKKSKRDRQKHGDEYFSILQYLYKNQQRVDTIVFTHIDNDHIGGALQAIERSKELPGIGRIIWNTGEIAADLIDIESRIHSEHISFPEDTDISRLNILPSTAGRCSVSNAGSLLEFFESRGLKNKICGAIQGECIPLEERAVIKVISPDKKGLEHFLREWNKEWPVRKSGGKCSSPESLNQKDLSVLCNEDFVKKDNSPTNQSSIAFLFEYKGFRIVFMGDAYPDVCMKGLKLHYSGPVDVDLLKLSHHGSEGNFSNSLCKQFRSDCFMLSTNGKGGKPSKHTIAGLFQMDGSIRLYCNYPWWETKHTYFSTEDKDEYINSGKIKLIELNEKPVVIKDGLILYGKIDTSIV